MRKEESVHGYLDPHSIKDHQSFDEDMSNDQEFIEFDSGSDSDQESIYLAAAIAVECETESMDPELEQSQAYDSKPERPYMDEPLPDQEWIAQYNRELEEAQQMNEALQHRFDGSEILENWYATRKITRLRLIKIIFLRYLIYNKFDTFLYRCTCANCALGRLQNAGECFCCQKVEKCLESLASDAVSLEVETTPPCVTMHLGFNAVCLNRWSLRSASAKYKTIDGRKYRQIGSEEK